MRAKFILKLNEKFIEDSDPINDMGIGIYAKHSFNNLESLRDWIDHCLLTILGTKEIPEDILMDPEYYIKPIYEEKINRYIREYITYLGDPADFNDLQPYIFSSFLKKKYNLDSRSVYDDENPDYPSIYDDEISEKFTDDSDPIEDMGIGINYLFKKTLTDFKDRQCTEIYKKYYEQYCDKSFYSFNSEIVRTIYHTMKYFITQTDTKEQVSIQEAFDKTSIYEIYNDYTSFRTEQHMSAYKLRKKIAEIFKIEYDIKLDPKKPKRT